MWTEQYSLKVDKWYTLMARGEDLASTVEDACSTKNEIEKQENDWIVIVKMLIDGYV